jgi:hypothetical protein
MLAETAEIAAEYYVSYLLDRANRTFLAMASVEGGMDRRDALGPIGRAVQGRHAHGAEPEGRNGRSDLAELPRVHEW